jgi:predicted acyl esterase
LFSPGDVYKDTMFPGGVLSTTFAFDYERFCTSLEKEGVLHPALYRDPVIPMPLSIGIQAIIRGINGVTGRQAEVPRAIEQHQNNWNMSELVESGRMVFADDEVQTATRTYHAHEFGATRKTFDGLVEHKVAVMNVAGYYDSGSVRGAARLHEYVRSRGGNSKLIVGPWGHAGRRVSNPYSSGGRLSAKVVT